MDIDFDKYSVNTLKQMLGSCIEAKHPFHVYYSDIDKMFPNRRVAKEHMDVIADYNYSILSFMEESEMNFLYKKGNYLVQFYETDLLELFATFQRRKHTNLARDHAEHQANVATVDAAQSSKISADASLTSAIWAKRSGWIAAFALLVAAGSWLRPVENDDIKDLQAQSNKQDSTINSLTVRIATLQDSLSKFTQTIIDTSHSVKTSR